MTSAEFFDLVFELVDFALLLTVLDACSSSSAAEFGECGCEQTGDQEQVCEAAHKSVRREMITEPSRCARTISCLRVEGVRVLTGEERF